MKRALRRHHKRRMKAKAVKVFSVFGLYGGDLKRHERLADHMCHCSCHMCGNGRRIWGHRTLKEEAFLCQPLDLED